MMDISVKITPGGRLRCECGRIVDERVMANVDGETIRLICDGCHQDLMWLELKKIPDEPLARVLNPNNRDGGTIDHSAPWGGGPVD